MQPPVLLLLLGLACYRLTRLVVKDSFPPIARPRAVLERRTLGTRTEAVGDLATCHWCASGWLSLGLIGGVDWYTDVSVPMPVVMWLAVWAVGALAAHLESEK
jgi:hypothetical protein